MGEYLGVILSLHQNPNKEEKKIIIIRKQKDKRGGRKLKRPHKQWVRMCKKKIQKEERLVTKSEGRKKENKAEIWIVCVSKHVICSLSYNCFFMQQNQTRYDIITLVII